MLTKSDINTGYSIAQVLGGHIGGSFIVHGEQANDFDIFIGRSAFECLRKGPYEFSVRAVNDGGQTVTFVNSWDTRSDYYQTNNTDDALYGTYRSTCGKYNLIVINDDFVLAFKISALRMAAAPELFQTKERRIELHHTWRQVIRTLLSDANAIAEITVSSKDHDDFPF